MVVLDAERPGWAEGPGLRDLLLLLRCVALHLLLELRLLDAGLGERRVERLADLRRPAGDAADVLDVALVLVMVAARGTPAREHHEQDDGKDQKGNQAGEPEHRDQPGGRADRAARPPGRLPPGHSHA